MKKQGSYSIKINSFKSKKKLGWKPKYNFKYSGILIHDWYNQYFKNKKLIFSLQIKNFFKITN